MADVARLDLRDDEVAALDCSAERGAWVALGSQLLCPWGRTREAYPAPFMTHYAERTMTYEATLTALLGLIGRDVQVSVGAKEGGSAPVFAIFGGRLERASTEDDLSLIDPSLPAGERVLFHVRQDGYDKLLSAFLLAPRLFDRGLHDAETGVVFVQYQGGALLAVKPLAED
jgi:hypothetical protein